ncbi:MAG: transposase [Nitrososphaerales archaeon]
MDNTKLSWSLRVIIWIRVYNALQRNGIDVKLANTFMNKAVTNRSIKTDRRSARVLAHLLKAGLISECYVPSYEARNVRKLLRHRMSMVKIQTMIRN